MSEREGQGERKRPSRLRRVTVWTLKGAGRAAWGGVKLLARGLWWSARAGWRAGRKFEQRRRARRQVPPPAGAVEPREK